jgi:transcriptional repressor NrdR
VRCPFCKEDKDKVIDSRSSDGGRIVRRRRQCLACSRRFTTYERIEEAVKLTVVKKDGSRVPYQRDSIIAGVQKACYKRPISMEQITQLAEEVEEAVFRHQGQEISSKFVGAKTMEQLEKLDKVAYVRFASVYREFEGVGEFLDEVNEVLQKPKDHQGQSRLFDE